MIFLDLHDEEGRFCLLPAGCLLEAQVHLSEHCARPNDEDTVLDELRDPAAKIGKVLAVLKAAHAVWLHLGQHMHLMVFWFFFSYQTFLCYLIQ